MNINSHFIPTSYQTLFSLFKKELDLLKKDPIIIAIDGHSSSGKSSLAKDLSLVTGYIHLDSGAMYRAVTLYFLNNAVDLQSTQSVSDALDSFTVDFIQTEGRQQVAINGEVVEDKIRSMDVSKFVSEVAAIAEVRKGLVKRQRALGQNKGIVMDGRDIGSVVFPNAEVKFFVTADLDVRASRRFQELESKGFSQSMNEVKENLIKRDHIDSTREDSPLVQAKDAIVIDTSHLDMKGQLVSALQHVFQRNQK